jgi:DNA polymerase III delta prime subunit
VGGLRSSGRVTALLQDGVVVTASNTLPRSKLVTEIIQASERDPFVILKGPPGCGKTSLLMLLEHELLRQGRNVIKIDMPDQDSGGLTGQATIEHAVSIELDRQPWVQGDPDRILLCDEIHRLYKKKFWDKFIKSAYLTKHHVHIIGAATRRYITKSASPVAATKFDFDKLRLSHEESTQLIRSVVDACLPSLRQAFQNERCFEDVAAAVNEQCAGHAFAITHSLRALDDHARLLRNKSSEVLIAELLSRRVASSYTRIWTSNSMEQFPKKVRDEVQAAYLDDSKRVSTIVQESLNKLFITYGQDTRPKKWGQLKESFISPLACRRFMNFAFTYGGPDGYVPKTIKELVLAALAKFRRILVKNNNKASTTNELGKEGGLQHMFFAALVEVLPPSTEVVSEMSAILPKRKGHAKGELDFYVNSVLYFGIELMRGGKRLAEHLARFESTGTHKSTGKYFTPKIKEHCVVDFVLPGFKPRKWPKGRLVVEFKKRFRGATLWEGSYEGDVEIGHACVGDVDFL